MCIRDRDKILADVIDKLEQKKLNDMKDILKDFTHIQIIFHAKALEMLSTAFKYLLEIDTESDLEEFRNNFTQSTINNLQYSSNKSLNDSNRQKYSNDDLFSGGSMPSTPGRSRNNLDQSRSKSNEPRRNMPSTSNLNHKQKNSKAHSSAPNLNDNKKSNMKNLDEDDDDDDYEDYGVEDVTDDSDAE